MLVIPAIDLINGKVVRLSKGKAETAKFYNYSPTEAALEWKAQGAKRLHIIDLDATFGKGSSLFVVADVARDAGVPVQVGGGIRSVAAAEKLLKSGISYVILGSLAFSDPEAITTIQAGFGKERVIVALDNEGGQVMVNGWKCAACLALPDALERFAKMGVKTFLITSIAQDGMLQGPDLPTLKEACKYPGVEVIAAGGISGLEDLKALKRIGAAGVVVGKALYEGRFTLKEAIATVETT